MLTFSVFQGGIKNTDNPQTENIKRVHDVLIGDSGRELTTWIRKFKDEGDAVAQSNAKCKLPYACFSGEFANRSIAGLRKYNGMVIADIDHCNDAEEIRDIIGGDKHCALTFVSPSGDGVKALFLTDCQDAKHHKAAFASLVKHVKAAHGLDLDPSGSDVSRACFLGRDPGAIYKPDAEPLAVDLSLAPAISIERRSLPNVLAWDKVKIGKNRHDYLFAYCRAMALAGQTVEEIVASATTMQANRFELKGGKPYADQREIVRQAEGAVLTFAKNADPVADNLHIGGVIEAWPSEHAPEGQEIEKAGIHALTEEQEDAAEKLKSMIPNELLKPGGIVQDVMDLIETQEIRTQPVLRLGAALTACGSLMGRNFRSKTNGRTNLYCLGIADSGTGKDAARGAIKMIFNGVANTGLENTGLFDDLNQRIAAEDLASGAGLLTLMKTNPTRLLLWDEFGKVLASVLGKYADGYKASICKELLRTYSSAASTLSGTAKADQSACPLETVYNPHLSIWGTTTGSTIWDVIGPQSFSDGLLPRFIVFIGDDTPPRHDNQYLPEIPEYLKEKIQNALHLMKKFEKEDKQDFAGIASMGPKIAKLIPRTPEADLAFCDFANFCEKQKIKAKKIDDKTGPIWTRAEQKADQVSIILAWSNNPEDPIVTEKEAHYAIDLIKWTTRVFIEHAEEHISETPFQKMKNEVLIALKNAGRQGVPSWLLAKKTLRTIDKKQRDLVMQTLDQEKAFVMVESEAARNGKRRKTLFLTRFAPKGIVERLDPDIDDDDDGPREYLLEE